MSAAEIVLRAKVAGSYDRDLLATLAAFQRDRCWGTRRVDVVACPAMVGAAEDAMRLHGYAVKIEGVRGICHCPRVPF